MRIVGPPAIRLLMEGSGSILATQDKPFRISQQIYLNENCLCIMCPSPLSSSSKKSRFESPMYLFVDCRNNLFLPSNGGKTASGGALLPFQSSSIGFSPLLLGMCVTLGMIQHA